MPESQKEPSSAEFTEPSTSEKRDERDAWRHEQEKHAYYYDDAHGYERYEPEDEEKTGIAGPKP